MVRSAPRNRFVAALIPLGAVVLVVAALGMAGLVLSGGAGGVVVVPLLGLHGAARFVLGTMPALLAAPVLLAAAAIWLVADSWRARLSVVALIAAALLSLTATGAFMALFWGVLALLIALALPAVSGLALAAIPVVLVGLDAGHAPAAIVPIVAICGGAVAVGAGLLAAITLDLAWLAGAVAAGFAGLGLLAAGLGAVPVAIEAVAAGAMIAPLLAIAASVLNEATGTRSLDWLGGLARGMPRFSLLLLAGFGFAGALPPGPGFVAFRALFGAAVGHGALGGFAVFVLASWFALIGFAAIRGFGLTCLGRPRSLRAAAAEGAPRPVLIAMALLALGGMALSVSSPIVLAVLVLLAVIAAAIWFGAYRAGPVDVAAFESGFAKPPAWLPFGDPATQITASGFAAGSLRFHPTGGWMMAWLKSVLRP